MKLEVPDCTGRYVRPPCTVDKRNKPYQGSTIPAPAVPPEPLIPLPPEGFQATEILPGTPVGEVVGIRHLITHQVIEPLDRTYFKSVLFQPAICLEDYDVNSF